jgi:hypothetical protein
MALFAEARRRRRRIRLACLGVFLVLAVAAGGSALGWTHRFAFWRASGGHRVAASASSASAPLIAWVDDNSRLHVGSMGTLRQRVVAELDADPGLPLVQAGGHIYWVDQRGGYVRGRFWPTTIAELNPRTGASRNVAAGEFAFPSADGRQLYISQTDSSLAELPAGGRGRLRQLTLPAGWYLPGGFGLAVANGIVVQSSDDQAIRRPPALAVWNQATGRLHVLGRGVGAFSADMGTGVGDAISAYTPPGAGYSLLAWMPAACRFPVSCPIRITNTLTLASRTLHSPLRYGFALCGAFSPDGRQLAVFVNRSTGSGGGAAELALASTGSGALRMVAGVRLTVGEDLGWARWLPGGRQLLVEGSGHEYLVVAATLSARPVSFTRDGAWDPNYSAVFLRPAP